MKRRVPYIVSLATVAGLLAVAPNIIQAQTTDPLLANSADQSMFPQITVQPLDQVVPLGTNVVLSMEANNADACQWLKDGVPLKGQTNNILILNDVGMNDVGLYSCDVYNGGPIYGEMVPTRAASVQVETTGTTTSANTLTASAMSTTMSADSLPAGGPITVMGTPLSGSGSQSTCPGSYIGYIHYSKSISDGWGWAPTSGVTTLTASDGSGRTNTKIQYFGLYGDMGCAQTTVTIPYPPISPVYQFTIFFTNDVPASTNYPLVLTGFNP